MKKKMLTVLLAAAMTVSLAGCGSKDADKKDNASVQNTENAKSDNGSDRTQFVVGFDAEFPPYGYMDEEIIPDLTLNWHRKYATVTDGNW